MKKNKICVVTGTRSDYGLLLWLMKSIDKDPNLELIVIATGMHLSPEFGMTFREIEKDGFTINKKIEMLLSADTDSSVAKSTGLGLIGFADAFKELKPDILVVLGDRFEVLAASIAATLAKIPIAHISGGEKTTGAYDETLRHSITKMSWWHFVATSEYEKRVIQLGENPIRVFNVGGTGVDTIKKSKLLSKDILMKNTNINFLKKNLLVTFHPVTLENNTSQQQFKILLEVLSNFKEIYLIFTMPNSDSNGRVIMNMIKEFVSKNISRSIFFTSMGHLNYISCLQFVDAVIGNSSSGLAEAPTFKIGTINIGDRQKGRIRANSVIDCLPEHNSITKAIKKLYCKKFQDDLKKVKNPYGEGNTTENIMKILKSSSIPKTLKKEFFDL